MQIKRQKYEQNTVIRSFSIGKGVRQGRVRSPYLFDLYSEYIMRQANLEELDIGVRMGGRKINNLR